MSKIKIIIKDMPGGGVSIVSDPPFEKMIKKYAAKGGLQASHGYALLMLKTALKVGPGGEPFKAIVEQEKDG